MATLSTPRSKGFEPGDSTGPGRLEFEMFDGEILTGRVDDYQPGVTGVYLVPTDPRSNNLRCFVVASAVRRASQH